jgi:small GTP-binding protein
MSERNIILLGDGGVGKTSWIYTHNTGEFEQKYCATVGADVHPLNVGNVPIHLWDVGGQDKYTPQRKNYYAKADAAVIMFDHTHKKSYESVAKWYAEVTAIKPNIPIILVGNKYDDETNRKIHKTDDYNMPYFKMSVKMREGLNEPFRWLTGFTTV